MPRAKNLATRLRLFDQATARHERRPDPPSQEQPTDRGWTREELYERGYPKPEGPPAREDPNSDF